jgi:hypothetical protein
MKNLITSIVLALALSFTVPIHAQLVLSPNPLPHAAGIVTESQFAAILNATPSGSVSGASTTIRNLSFFGTHLTLGSIPSGSITDTKQVALTAPQVAALLAALPTLPNNEVSANVKTVNAYRGPQGVTLNIQFSQ